MQDQPVVCVVCGQTFSYRYVGRFEPSALLLVDRVCRACFGPWATAWSRAHQWV